MPLDMPRLRDLPALGRVTPVQRPVERYVVAGGRRLTGEVVISGAKNAVLPILAASLLTRSECVLHNVPRNRDVATMVDILRRMGVSITGEDAGCAAPLVVCARDLASWEVLESLTREIRASIILMGALLGRLGRVRISYPGGCAIGPRPIDFHLRGLEALGAHIVERYGYIDAEAPRLHGRDIYLDFPSVGATENLMLAAVLADGVTVIKGAAREPEIVDLQNFLNGMGARVHGAGLDAIRIEGVSSLGGVEHQVMPDRIETGTFMSAAAITGGDVLVTGAASDHVQAVAAKLREMGATISEDGRGLRTVGPHRLTATDIKTLPYPGFPTDMQPQLMVLLATAVGTGIITETIFENRLQAADELRRMGAQIKLGGRVAVVQGVPRLTGATVAVPALREGSALVLAGLVADGITTLEHIHHIDRGYEGLDSKLRGLGADIKRVG